MKPVAAGPAVAEPARPVPGQVNEHGLAGRRSAAAESAALAHHHHLGESHGEVGGHPVCQRSSRPGHVDVRPAPIVGHDLGNRPSLPEQSVQHGDGRILVGPVAGGHDGGEAVAVRAQPGDVPRPGGPPVECITPAERLDIRDRADAVRGTGTAGVDQFGACPQRLDQVRTKTTLTPVGPLS